MPAPVGQAIVPGHPQQLSVHAMVLCCVCFLATFCGASAVTLSLSLVLQAHAGSTAYWMMTITLLIIWFVTLINMHRIALAAVLVEK